MPNPAVRTKRPVVERYIEIAAHFPKFPLQNMLPSLRNLVVPGVRLLLRLSMLFMFLMRMVPVVDARPTERPLFDGVPHYRVFDGTLGALFVVMWVVLMGKLCATSVDIAFAIGKPLARLAMMMLCFMFVLGAMSFFAFSDDEHNVIYSLCYFIMLPLPFLWGLWHLKHAARATLPHQRSHAVQAGIEALHHDLANTSILNCDSCDCNGRGCSKCGAGGSGGTGARLSPSNAAPMTPAAGQELDEGEI